MATAKTADPLNAIQTIPNRSLEEVAAILATGMRRLLSARAAASRTPLQGTVPTPAESARNCLDESSESRLSVPRG
jgi:hypothetical protein